MYAVEKVPVENRRAGKAPNPITAQMRKLNVGESFVIAFDDPNWTGCQVRNESGRNGARYCTRREPGGLRIGRVE